MKKLISLILLSFCALGFSIQAPAQNILGILQKQAASNPVHDKAMEKQLKKRYKTVDYMAHADCYLVTAKGNATAYGICDLQGNEIVEPVYKKCHFQKTSTNETLIFCETPNAAASERGNKIYSLSRGEILNVGTAEPWYIDGDYLSSYGKPIYNLSGNIVLDCETSNVQPVRHGSKIVAYRVSVRSMVNGAAKDQLWFCDDTFNKLFELEGQGYLWKIDESTDDHGQTIWVCTSNDREKGKILLTYDATGSLIDNTDNAASGGNLMASAEQPKQETRPQAPQKNNNPTKPQTPAKAQNTRPAAPTKPASTRPPVARRSDIDNPPVSKTVAENTFAVIIANENYSEVDDVPFALNDGASVEAYCRTALGIPEKNIRSLQNATLNQMKRQLRWLQQIAEAYGKDAKVIFYYSGHGMPDEDSKEAYLLPVDGYYGDMTTNLAVNELYSSLSALNVGQVAVFLDACFSGTQRSDQMLVAARGVKIKARSDRPKGNMIVMSAAQANETAYPYEEKSHGMFTYFLLKKIKESGSKVSLGELGDYIIDKVKKTSLVQNDKIQTPSLAISPDMEQSWRNQTLN